MKTKLTFAIIIATVFIAAMVVYGKTMEPSEIILAFTSSAGVLGWLWKWINEKELKEENAILKVMHKSEFRKNQLNVNIMNDNEIQVILEQVQYINNNLSATHTAKQVALETIENLESVIGGGGIKNNPPS